MALSGSASTAIHSSGRSVAVNWTATQDIANNRSTISWTLVGSGSFSGWVNVGELRVTIDNEIVFYRSSAESTPCYPGTQLASGTKIISHNNDGSRTFSIKVEAGIYQYSINVSGNATFSLNTIARASTISDAPDAILGENSQILWTPTSKNFSYKLKFEMGSYSHTTDIINPNSTSEFIYDEYIYPIEIANQFSTSDSGLMSVSLFTYSDSNGIKQIGSTSSKSFVVSISDGIIPIVNSVNVTVDNSENEKLEEWGVPVAGYSKLKIEATATGADGSTIVGYEVSGEYNVSVNGESLSYTGDIIQSSGSKNLSVVAIDSRGRKSEPVATKTVNFHYYRPPIIEGFNVERSKTEPRKAFSKADWQYSSVNGHNTILIQLWYKRAFETEWNIYGGIPKDKKSEILLDFDENSSYSFKLVVTDALGNNAQSETSISTSIVLMDFKAGGKGLGIGKIAETDAMEVALPVIFLNDIKIRVGNTDMTLQEYIQSIIGGGKIVDISQEDYSALSEYDPNTFYNVQ